jgi:hypothetical protein
MKATTTFVVLVVIGFSLLWSKAANVPSFANEPAGSTVESMDRQNISAEGRLAILQIGDSHTSADFFTGELRRLLQARYGPVGTGYMTAGLPPGVRSSILRITVSSGWRYTSLKDADTDGTQFSLSGYNTIATTPGETIRHVSERPLHFSSIEIEALSQPGGGSIEIKVDGKVQKELSLASDRNRHVTIQVQAPSAVAELHEVSITITRKGLVSISSISIYSDRDRLTYSGVGYLGATVGILNKLSEQVLANDLDRINPQIVVLSFGTNEAANGKLDLGDYRDSYERVVTKIRIALPGTMILVISPPDFNQLSPGCSKAIGETICRNDGPHLPQEMRGKVPCFWETPTKLAQVRDVQRDIANRYGAIYWDWGSIMPNQCGAHEWYKTIPPLMSRDHVHMTAEGYRESAKQFVAKLIPAIESFRVRTEVVPHD